MSEIQIVNIVGAGDLQQELNIEQVGKDIAVPYSEYDPSNYHGLYLRPVEDGPLITVYRSGKYIVTGPSSLEELYGTNEKFLTKLGELDGVGEFEDTGFAVQNIVSTAELDDSVNLNALSISLGLEATEYEPEQFPGLIYRPAEYPVVLLVFATGKVVITGTADTEVTRKGFEHLQSRIDFESA